MVVSNSKVYKYGYLTFILYNKDIIIKTSLNQTFYLLPNGYWTVSFARNRLDLIRNLIKVGEIRDFNELAGYTRPGIKWVCTNIDYKIDDCDIKLFHNVKRRIKTNYEYDV